MEEKDVIIKVDHISKQYKLGMIDFKSLLEERKARKSGGESTRRKTLHALQDVSFEIRRGEAIGLIGGNGAGKSTLLKIISRVTVPTEGNVYIDGTLSSLLEVGTGFHPELSGRENIYINGTILGMKRKEIDAKIEDIIDFSECREFIDTPVKRYSSGMYVKLAFAISAFLESEIMILDEVLAVGDVRFQAKCLEKIKELVTSEDRTVICVSHNMNTISRLCDRCIVMDHGKMIFDGDTTEAINHYFGYGQFGEVLRDYRDKRRFAWLTQDAVRTDKVQYVGKEVAYYYDDEKIKVKYDWHYNDDVIGLSLRFEVRDEKDNPVATSVLAEFANGKKGEEGSITFEQDISWLKEGKYKTIYTLYVVNALGITEDLDCVDGLSFKKEISNHPKLQWVSKSWGCIELPAPTVVN